MVNASPHTLNPTLFPMVVTTSRADYGLLKPLLDACHLDTSIDASLLVTGSHLSPAHGHTLDIIRQDGFDPIVCVGGRTGESPQDLATVMGQMLPDMSQVLQTHPPDCLIVLGDRFELWPVCMAAALNRIPIVHIHGGETTEGALDEVIRHSITKMATLHFPSIEVYGRRIIQMGESPDRVFVVGALGIDAIQQTPHLSIDELSARTQVNFQKVNFEQPVALMTYHPVTLDAPEEAKEQVEIVLEALDRCPQIHQILITMPNVDAGWQGVAQAIHAKVNTHPERFFTVASLGQAGYYSAMAHSAVMVGNSSSGILEAASFQLPVVNIGDRQAGRLHPPNVVNALCEASALDAALEHALSPPFQCGLKELINPYGTGHTASQIISVLKQTDWSQKAALLKKTFYDLEEFPSPPWSVK